MIGDAEGLQPSITGEANQVRRGRRAVGTVRVCVEVDQTRNLLGECFPTELNAEARQPRRQTYPQRPRGQDRRQHRPGESPCDAADNQLDQYGRVIMPGRDMQPAAQRGHDQSEHHVGANHLWCGERCEVQQARSRQERLRPRTKNLLRRR